MRVVYERCAGLDVHKRSVVACVRTREGQQTRTFGTMTGELLELLDWLMEAEVTHVAMESTGVYWKPVYNLLEGAGLEVLLVNARHIKAVPGRKTDVKDAEWIAELLCHGLLRGSLVPDRAQRELRELVRYRRSLIQERSREASRLQKVLEGANVKLASVASDVLGKSGRAMLEAIASGQTEPQQLASLARGRLRSKNDQLRQALEGLVGEHQRLLIREQLSHIAELEARIERLSEEVHKRLHPFEEVLARVQTIPGLGPRTSEDILAEIGFDMSVFPSDRHLASWARICPGTHQSANRSGPAHIGLGNPWLRSALVESAQAAARTKNTYLRAQYQRIARRRGKKRATIAVAHTLLIILYHVIKEGAEYCDLGEDYFDRLHHDAVVRFATKRLERLGYRVQLERAA